MRRLSVAVVQGGPSTEAEVSRASAAGVARALADTGHAVVRLELDAFVAESLRTGGFDVVFPVVHGAVGEDGSLQGLLEVLDLPYVGSGVVASALGMSKHLARVLFAQAGLPVAQAIVARRGPGGFAAAHEAAERARREVGARVVVKPSSHGSAIGVARLEGDASTAEVARAIEQVWEIDEVALVEHFAKGREVTCGVLEGLEGEAARALPPTEILAPSDAFYSFEARYASGRSVHICPAQLGDAGARVARVQEIALSAHRVLGCRDLSRADFVVGDVGAPEAVTLLEVNTLPGMTATSLFPEAAAVAGWAMPELCDGLVQRAHRRYRPRTSNAKPLPR
ncbi:MAG TPA: D-alanine--D-alanine ligase [Polyangiaceae bacterium]|nr:D-alanine--D-alanine ligase [Polyangiaceae bacterium]